MAIPTPTFRFQFNVIYQGSVDIQAGDQAAARLIFNQLQVPNLVSHAGKPGIGIIQIQSVNTDPDNYNP